MHFSRCLRRDRKGRGLCAAARRCRLPSLGYRGGRVPRFRAGRRRGALCRHQRQRRGTARSFTFLHELVHIWLGASGVSGPLRDVPENVVERFCNDTASEFLLPPGSIADLSSLQTAPFEDVNRVVQSLASTWKVSEPAVAYRLAQNGWIDPNRWRRRCSPCSSSAGASKSCARGRAAHRTTRADYYTVRRHRLGAGLLNVVRRALQDE